MELLDYLAHKIATTRGRERSGYRIDMIKALILSYPAGHLISESEFSAAAQYPVGSTGGYNLLARLISRGEIKKIGHRAGSMYRYSYEVIVPPNTYDEERGVATATSAQPMPVKAEPEKVEEVIAAEFGDDQRTRRSVQRARRGVARRGYTLTDLESIAMKLQFYNEDVVLTASKLLSHLKEE